MPAADPPDAPGPTRGIAEIARVDPGREALSCGDRRLTFAELEAWSNASAHAYAARGVGPGDRVAVRLGNGFEIFAAWNGAARRGALVVPVSTRLTAEETAYLVSDSGARTLVHDAAAAAVEGAAAARADALAVGAAELAARPAVPPDDLGDTYLGTPVVTMNYTSGTTGRPKGIVRAAPPAAAVAPPSPFAAFWGFSAADVHLLCGPAYHTAPGAYAQMSLVEGGRVVVMPTFDAEECLALVERERVTTAHMVPANFIRILQVDWRAHDRTSVRKVLHAAAPCPVAVKRRILEVFPPGAVWEYYGASEGMASVISSEEWERKPGSVGRPFPGISVRIVTDDGGDAAPGEIGMIYISVFSRQRFTYHNAPEKTEEAWRQDHFTAGDLGSLDADGYLFLADRRTDLVISGGVNIYPAEVEAALVEEPDVVDAAVFGLPDERMGQRVHAVVELRPGAPADADTLVARLARRLADFKLPRSVEFVDELPREPNGKVLKTRLRAERMAGTTEEAKPT